MSIGDPNKVTWVGVGVYVKNWYRNTVLICRLSKLALYLSRGIFERMSTRRMHLVLLYYCTNRQTADLCDTVAGRVGSCFPHQYDRNL